MSATYEACRSITVAVTNDSSGVGAALPFRFCTWKTSGAFKEVITHVPGANGAAARGILGMKTDQNVKSAVCSSTMVLPDGCQALIELGEAVTAPGQAIRVGGNSTEVDGAGYLADATGDVIVAYALETGAVGEVIAIEFVGYAGLVP
jgi:hypothetical protein